MLDNKCPNCGANVQFNENKTESKCPYCGSSFNSENKKEEIKYKTIKDLQIDDNEEVVADGKINMTIFILLLIFCTPAAIIYLIICGLKK